MENPIHRVSQKLKREHLHSINRVRIARISGQLPKADPGKAPIVVLNASTRLESISLNAGFSLITAWALRMAGYPVIHFVCQRGMSRCVLGTDRGDLEKAPPCEKCLATSKNLYQNASVQPFVFKIDEVIQQQIELFDFKQLEEFALDGVPLGTLIIPSMRWILRRHHLQDDENTCRLARQYILSAASIMRQFTDLLDQVHPQSVLVFNGMFYPEAVARFLAMQRGIPVYTHEVGMLPLSAFFTGGEATAYPIDIPADFQLSEEQDRRLDDYLSQRMEGNFSTAGVEFWPEMRTLDAGLQKEIGSFEAVVPIFTNVVFDTSQSHANVLFPHMFAWLETVLKSIRAHPETLFIIRAHPDELRPGKESAETVAEWISQNHVLDLPNVRFINAREFISSYDLVKIAKFVMVYNSTIGLEASILKKPVLCAGKARYTQLPTVFLPQTQQAFHTKMENFLTSEKINVPDEFHINSRRVLYSQLFMASLPFDAFLEDEQHWKGFVTIKDFKIDLLKAQNSSTIRTILRGIQEKEQFLLKS